MENENRWTEFDRLFGNQNMVGKELLPVMEAERKFGEWVNHDQQTRNHYVEATLGFVLETITRAHSKFIENPDPVEYKKFKILLAWYTAHFRRFRASEVAFYAGYGMSGTSLLRDVRDWCFQIAALQHNEVTWQELHGGLMGGYASAENAVEEKQQHYQALKSQKRVKAWAYGKKSGIEKWQDLQKWARYPNLETHGSNLTTLIEFGPWLEDTANLSFGPTVDSPTQKHYPSRSIETAHLFLRILPVLQVPKAFGSAWVEKWKCLDALISEEWEAPKASAKYMLAFGNLLELKLNFDPDSTRLGINFEMEEPTTG